VKTTQLTRIAKYLRDGLVEVLGDRECDHLKTPGIENGYCICRFLHVISDYDSWYANKRKREEYFKKYNLKRKGTGDSKGIDQ
jgi:hypothetical protein